MVWVQREKWGILQTINIQIRKKIVVSVFANEPGILHIVLIFAGFTVLENWTSVYEICFHTFKTFPFTAYCVLMHLSSVRFTVKLDVVKGLFQTTWFCDYDFEKNADFSAITQVSLYLALCRVVCNMNLIWPAGKSRILFALPSAYLFISLVFWHRTVDKNKLGNKNSI